MPILVHFKTKNNNNSYFYKNSGLSFQWVPYYVNIFVQYVEYSTLTSLTHVLILIINLITAQLNQINIMYFMT